MPQNTERCAHFFHEANLKPPIAPFLATAWDNRFGWIDLARIVAFNSPQRIVVFDDSTPIELTPTSFYTVRAAWQARQAPATALADLPLTPIICQCDEAALYLQRAVKAERSRDVLLADLSAALAEKTKLAALVYRLSVQLEAAEAAVAAPKGDGPAQRAPDYDEPDVTSWLPGTPKNALEPVCEGRR